MGNVYTANYIPKNILFYLWEKEINTVVLKQDPGIRGAVTSHPDLFLCKMGVEADAPLIRAPKGAVGSAYLSTRSRATPGPHSWWWTAGRS